jgi:hypothetical protein
MKNLTSRQHFAGVLFLALVIMVPLTMILGTETTDAFQIYGNYHGSKELQAAGLSFGALYGAGAALGIICGVQLAVGLIAVA